MLRSGQRRQVSEHLKSLGFVFVTIDLEGYRMGSLNEALGGESGGDGGDEAESGVC